jgi:hypothetical protein
MTFLRTIATHRFTLLFAAVFTVITWVIHANHVGTLTTSNITAFADFAGGMVLCGLTVYLTAELNNAFALLRISSRMISATLTLLLAPAVFLHPLQNGHAVMMFAVSVLFPVFASYKNSNAPVLPLTTFLFMSLASLFYPRLLYTAPLYLLILILMRSFSLRHLLAGIIGLSIPYWFFFTVSFCRDSMSLMTWHFNQLVDLPTQLYSTVTLQQWLVAGLMLLLFLIGSIHHLMTAHEESTRTRQNYSMVMLAGFASFVMLALLPSDFSTVMPLCMIPTAITGGHFFALSTGKVLHIVAIIISVMIFALTAYSL